MPRSTLRRFSPLWQAVVVRDGLLGALNVTLSATTPAQPEIPTAASAGGLHTRPLTRRASPAGPRHQGIRPADWFPPLVHQSKARRLGSTTHHENGIWTEQRIDLLDRLFGKGIVSQRSRHRKSYFYVLMWPGQFSVKYNNIRQLHHTPLSLEKCVYLIDLSKSI